MKTSTVITIALPLLASGALAKTDLSGCTSTQMGSNLIFYVPDTYEICSIPDCGGGRAPTKTDVPGCPGYKGDSSVAVSYLSGHSPKTQAGKSSSPNTADSSENYDSTEEPGNPYTKYGNLNGNANTATVTGTAAILFGSHHTASSAESVATPMMAAASAAGSGSAVNVGPQSASGSGVGPARVSGAAAVSAVSGSAASAAGSQIASQAAADASNAAAVSAVASGSASGSDSGSASGSDSGSASGSAAGSAAKSAAGSGSASGSASGSGSAAASASGSAAASTTSSSSSGTKLALTISGASMVTVLSTLLFL